MSTAQPAHRRHGRQRRVLLLALGASLALTACAPLLPSSPAGGTPAAARTALPAFLLEGRLSASDGVQGASGRLEWQHTPDADTLVLLSPLGQIAARLDSSAEGARLSTADGAIIEAPSADLLLPRVLNVDIPAARLRLWVQAVTDGSAEVRLRDTAGRPVLLIDRGWRIEYAAYADDSAQALPTRVDISRGDARIRLIADSWTILP